MPLDGGARARGRSSGWLEFVAPLGWQGLLEPRMSRAPRAGVRSGRPPRVSGAPRVSLQLTRRLLERVLGTWRVPPRRTPSSRSRPLGRISSFAAHAVRLAVLAALAPLLTRIGPSHRRSGPLAVAPARREPAPRGGSASPFAVAVLTRVARFEPRTPRPFTPPGPHQPVPGSRGPTAAAAGTRSRPRPGRRWGGAERVVGAW